jgi:hypothetical protein
MPQLYNKTQKAGADEYRHPLSLWGKVFIVSN